MDVAPSLWLMQVNVMAEPDEAERAVLLLRDRCTMPPRIGFGSGKPRCWQVKLSATNFSMVFS